jgi:hypothetical protein
MNIIIELDSNYSTTRRVIKADQQEIAGLVKVSYKPEDKFETLLFLPEGEGKQGEGGLRKHDYFKVGGIIPSPSAPPPSRDETISAQTPNPAHGVTASSFTVNSTSEEKPLITFVTVVFNGEKFLEKTILSIINQTYDNIEYIIIDGGSTDGTLDIIKKYEQAIDYWVSEKDKGIYDAMNKGIDLATGEWINFMNAGDRLLDFNQAKVFTKNNKLRAYCFPVINTHSDGSKVLFKGRLTNPHQGIFYMLQIFKNIGKYEQYKLISDRLYFDEMKNNNVDLIYSNMAIAEFDMSGVSSSSAAKNIHRLEFRHNFLRKKTLMSLYRYVRSFF